MLSTLVNTVFVLALATPQVAADLQLLTPALTQCQDALISYSGGQPNYALYVVPSGDPCADSLVGFPVQSGKPLKWKVNLPAGAIVELMVEDAASVEAWSGAITVQNSSDASCVDSKATQALIAANSLPQSSSSTSSSATSIISSSAVSSMPSTAVKASTYGGASGAKNTVVPVPNPSLANAAGSNPTSLSSSSLPRISLPACSLLGIAAFLLIMIHLT